jgi:protoheme IX farnesyltransferase
VPGALPPAIGVAAAGGSWWLATALFAVLACWQMPHFFGLATLYRDDYRQGGFRMLPGEPNGERRAARQSVFFAALLVPISLTPALAPGIDWLYVVPAVLLGGWFFGAAARTVADTSRATARRLFLVSIAYLPALLFVLVLDRSL